MTQHSSSSSLRRILGCLFLLQSRFSHGFVAVRPANSIAQLLTATRTTLNVAAEHQDLEIAASLLERAQQLRDEANDLETKLTAGTTGRRSAAATEVAKVITYNELPDSVWKLTYRFADQPMKNDDSNDDDTDNTPIESYRGEVTLKFKADGYTEIVSTDSNSNSNSNSQVRIDKVWGWDKEVEVEDGGKIYVLFSMDAKTPNTDKEKFYFQAELQRNDGIISLKSGTVTIKEDLAKTKKIMNFGFFSPKGILAQFRYVGDFVAKPASE